MGAFHDNRTYAELLLAPRKPLTRNASAMSAVKLNLGGVALPGVVSDPTQLAGPLRNTLSQVVKNKTAVKLLSTAVTAVLANFDAQRQKLQAGTYIPPDPMLAPPPMAGSVPDVTAFFSFSMLTPGQPVPASFHSIIQQRKVQLQQLSRSFSAIFTSSDSAGVSISENMNPTPYPLPDQLDVPDCPRLAQGGAVAQADAILQDKIKFTVHGVTIGAGKPSVWSRLIGAALQAIPNLNSTVNQIFTDKNHGSSWSEPVTPYAAVFPYNHVQQTEAGHVWELDDTPGAERVHIFHRSGSFVEMHPDGSVVYKTMKHGYRVTMADEHVKVNGSCHVAVDGDSTLYVKGSVQMQSDGDFNVNTTGDFNVFASNVNLRAKQTFKADGTLMDLRYIKLPTMFAFEVPTGIPFPIVNLTAIAADFPGGDFTPAPPSMDPNAGVKMPGFGDTTPPVIPPTTPLANWSTYTAATPEAISYRAKLFDTPEEVQDVQLYTAHASLQVSLGDTTATSRQLGGVLSQPESGIVVPTTKPTVIFLSFDDYSGKFDYANSYVLAGTSFTLADVADLALHPTVVADITCTADNMFESAPDDGTSYTGGGSNGAVAPTTAATTNAKDDSFNILDPFSLF